MAYQVIARKYRPQRFSDVVGQEHVTRTLSQAIEQKRIAHAYLFCGPRGTGKTTIARIFAKCLNCTAGPKVEFGDDDERCKEITEGRSIDVLEIDGASNRGIEEIRELRETVKYAPATSKYKIYIIDEVHMLTKEAFNALLKTLEEPPEHVKFMFATTEPEKVLPTILSRCQRFDLRRIPVKLIVDHLADISKKEKVKIDTAALTAIARGAEGCMRDAESALDQLISFCGEEIAEPDVLSMFGLAAQSQVFALASGVLTGDAQAVLKELDDLSKHGKDLGRLLGDVLGYFRNLLIYHISRGDLKLLEATEAEAASLAEHAKLVTPDALTRIMEVLTDAEAKLKEVASKKIFMEVTLLKAIDARKAVSIETVIAQLHQMRGGGSPAPAPAPTSVAADVRRRTDKVAMSIAIPPAPEGLRQLWPALVEAAQRASRVGFAFLTHGEPVSFDNKVLTVRFPAEESGHLEIADTKTLEAKLAELGHPGAQIRFVVSEAAPAAVSAPAPQPIQAREEARPARPQPPPTPQKLNVEDFKNDPLIQKALEIFRGNIVEVRAGI
ncbi:MAG TPA: DNA polymerase III subunit gamma/tau [Verrucomicrobiae bacterium]|nr:DNA polymerase III subunit gamma/tau [Verrucomicrobiae bacterium]